MLSGPVVGWLREHLLDNDVVLFLGAGFSSEAQNMLGRTIPKASELAGQLYEEGGFSATRPFSGEKLEDVFESARYRLGDKRLLEFLIPRLSASSVPEWYGYAADFPWLRIYTTNVDNVIETAWKLRKGGVPKLRVIVGSDGELEERDQILSSIQYVKLNGSIERGIGGITFSRRQYAQRLGDEDRWVDLFVQDYFHHPTVFIGTELEDPILWSYIERRERMAREKGMKDPRPKALLISPDLSPAKEPILDSLHIEPVRTSAREFFEVLHTQLSGVCTPEVVLRRVFAQRKMPLELASVFLTREVREHLAAFHTAFREVRPKARDPQYHSYFLLGAQPTWDDIAASLDALREVTGALTQSIRSALAERTEPRIAFLKGTAGSGKSTVLMRLSISLKQEGVPCFFSDGECIPEWYELRTALESYERPVVLFLDNAHKFLLEVSDWGCRFDQFKHPPILICACRVNQFERNLGAIRQIPSYSEVDIPDLSDGEIEGILRTLEAEQLLGRLRERSRSERIRIFRDYAKRQIVVAMRAATLSEDFDKIIADEFLNLPYEAKIIYTIAALPTSQHHTITQGELLAACPLRFSQTLDLLATALRGLVIRKDSAEDTWQARHQVIAEMIVDNIAPRDMVCNAYIGYLRAISHQIPTKATRRCRPWQIFWRLLNHQNLYQQFGNEIENPRKIYESLKGWLGTHGHFWLQYGSLEIEYGQLDRASNYIEQAKGILGESHYPVMATYAYLLLKKAIRTHDAEEANRMAKEGEAILLSQIAEIGRRDPYPYHILGTQLLLWLRDRIQDKEERRSGMLRLREIVGEGVQNHPGRKELRAALNSINYELLMMKVG
jgi:hypothetical protein